MAAIKPLDLNKIQEIANKIYPMISNLPAILNDTNFNLPEYDTSATGYFVGLFKSKSKNKEELAFQHLISVGPPNMKTDTEYGFKYRKFLHFGPEKGLHIHQNPKKWGTSSLTIGERTGVLGGNKGMTKDFDLFTTGRVSPVDELHNILLQNFVHKPTIPELQAYAGKIYNEGGRSNPWIKPDKGRILLYLVRYGEKHYFSQ